MAYTLVSNGSKQYAVEWNFVERLVRSYCLATARALYTQWRTIPDREWGSLAADALPRLVQIDVDWDAVARRAMTDTSTIMNELRAKAARDVRGVSRDVQGMVALYKKRNADFLESLKRTQASNIREIDAVAAHHGSWAEGFKIIRDTSADALLVAAAVVPGGLLATSAASATSAAAAVVGGSALKGIARFQDYGSWTGGVWCATTNLVFGILPLGIGRDMKKAEKLSLIVVQAVSEGANTAIEGRGFVTALILGATKLTAYPIERILSAEGLKKVFMRVPIPATVVASTDSGVTDLTEKFNNKVAAKLLQKQGAERGAKWLAKSVTSGPPATPRAADKPQSALQAPLCWTDDWMLAVAFVDQAKWVGAELG